MAAESKPVALRGFLSGTSIDFLRGKRSLTGSPYNANADTPKSSSILTPYNRAIHGTSALSESAKGIPSNRPLSPNLILKKPQLSATYSISHRIFGAALGTVILLSPVIMKFRVVYDV